MSTTQAVSTKNIPRGDITQRLPVALEPTTKTEFNIVIIGEGGVGKTSLISLLLNVFGQKPLHQNALANVPASANGVTTYTAQRSDGATLRVLDTAGLANAGLADNEDFRKNVVEGLEGLNFIDGILIVADGTRENLGKITASTIEALSPIFPKSAVIKNTAFLVTRVASALTSTFVWDQLKTSIVQSDQTELQGLPRWWFQNPISMWEKYCTLVNEGELDGKVSLSRDLVRRVIAAEFETLDFLDSLFKWLDGNEALATETITNLYESLMNMQSVFLQIFDDLVELRKKSKELYVLLEHIKANNKDIDINKEFERITTPLKWIREARDRFQTICQVEGCHSNCHSPCTISGVADATRLARNCLAFAGGKVNNNKSYSPCLVCKHPASSHAHEKKIWVQIRETVSIVDDNMYANFLAAKTLEQKLEAMKKLVEEAIARVEKQITVKSAELEKATNEFQQLSANPAFVANLVTFINNIVSFVGLLKAKLEDGDTSADDLIKVLENKVQDGEKRKQVADKGAVEVTVNVQETVTLTKSQDLSSYKLTLTSYST